MTPPGCLPCPNIPSQAGGSKHPQPPTPTCLFIPSSQAFLACLRLPPGPCPEPQFTPLWVTRLRTSSPEVLPRQAVARDGQSRPGRHSSDWLCPPASVSTQAPASVQCQTLVSAAHLFTEPGPTGGRHCALIHLLAHELVCSSWCVN
jgi:hypothetical protein